MYLLTQKFGKLLLSGFAELALTLSFFASVHIANIETMYPT